MMYLYPILSVLLVAAAMPVSIRLARRFALYDHPDNGRKMHEERVPFTGGYSIIVAFWLTISAMWFFEGVHFFTDQYASFVPMYLYIIEASIIIVVLGVIDDLKELTYSQKFFFQFIAAFLMILGAIKSNLFPSVFSVSDSGVILNSIGMIISLLWLVGTTNAINMIDGMDGLAGGTSLVSAVALAVVAFLWGNPVIGIIMLTLAGAILGFLFFNLPPARVFMGNGGSMFIGFTLAFNGWMLVDSGPGTMTSYLVPVAILGLPIVDTLLAFFRRIVKGRNPFSADLNHIHHMLKRTYNLTLKKAVSILCLVSVMYALGGVAIALLPAVYGVLLIIAMLIANIVFLHRIGYTDLLRTSRLDIRPVNGAALPANGVNGHRNGKNGSTVGRSVRSEK